MEPKRKEKEKPNYFHVSPLKAYGSVPWAVITRCYYNIFQINKEDCFPKVIR